MRQPRIKIAQTRLGLKETRFENPRLARLGVEVISSSYLYRRTTKQALRRPERVHFYMLMFVTGGRGRHSVDCATAPVSAGSLILVRPGHVQQWHPQARYDAEIVLFDPTALQPAATSHVALTGLNGCPAHFRIPRAGRARAVVDLRTLKNEIRHFDGSELAATLIRQLLLVLLLQTMRWSGVARAQRGDSRSGEGAHQLFLRALEAEYRSEHRVYYYARRLGISVSTLNRVCALAEGRSAKAAIDGRIALEAQRLLIHSRASYAEISHHLGYSETTNFVKFFTRVVGHRPAELRRPRLLV